MCDLDAHIYLLLLEELNYVPTHRYSYGPEILAHSQRIGRHYKLDEHTCSQTTTTSMRWQEKERCWLVETDRGDRRSADYVVMACGRQSLLKLPGIPGIDMFEGHACHSGPWDYRHTGGETDGELVGLTGKRIGLLGTGARSRRLVHVNQSAQPGFECGGR